MNDERAVEAMRTILNRMDDPAWTVPQVQTFLAALRAEGYELYRPDECELGQVDGVTFNDNPEGMDGLIVLVPSREHYATRQKVRLVPVGGEG